MNSITYATRSLLSLPLLFVFVVGCATAPPPPAAAPTETLAVVAPPSSTPPPRSAPSVAPSHVEARPTPQLAALAQARIDAAEKLYADIQFQVQRGVASSRDLILVPRAAHAAYAEGGIVGDARIAWAAKNVERMRAIEALMQSRVNSAAAPRSDLDEVVLARTEAEFWLEEAKR